MKFPVALLVVLGSVACTPAFATITTYKSRAAFEAAGTTTNLADFEGLALGSHGSLIIQNGVRLDTTYAAFSADLFLIPGGSNFTNP